MLPRNCLGDDRSPDRACESGAFDQPRGIRPHALEGRAAISSRMGLSRLPDRPPGDAVRRLQALFAGRLLRPAMLRQMLIAVPVGGAINGLPWTECGSGLGLMIDRMGGARRAIGHSAGGPFSVNVVYHSSDRLMALTVASFADKCGDRPVPAASQPRRKLARSSLKTQTAPRTSANLHGVSKTAG